MSRKAQKKRKDDLCCPGLEKKQKSIAMTSLKEFHDYLTDTVRPKIDAILDTLERDLPEGVTMVRDEPLPKKHDMIIRLTSYGFDLPICTLRKDYTDIIVAIDYGGTVTLGKVVFTDQDEILRNTGAPRVFWVVDHGHPDRSGRAGIDYIHRLHVMLFDMFHKLRSGRNDCPYLDPCAKTMRKD